MFRTKYTACKFTWHFMVFFSSISFHCVSQLWIHNIYSVRQYTNPNVINITVEITRILSFIYVSMIVIKCISSCLFVPCCFPSIDGKCDVNHTKIRNLNPFDFFVSNTNCFCFFLSFFHFEICVCRLINPLISLKIFALIRFSIVCL